MMIWHTTPQDAGQATIVEYCGTGDGCGWRRTYERGALEDAVYEWSDLDACGCDRECHCWDPANGGVSSKLRWTESTEKRFAELYR